MSAKEVDEIKSLINRVKENPESINELSKEELIDLAKNFPYGCLRHDPKHKYTCFSISNLKEEYIKYLHMTSIVSFLYRTLDEYNGVEDKTDIKNFLDSVFEFNPDYHVKCDNKENKDFTFDKKFNHKEINIPNDTFYRYNNYLDVNYDYMRSITDRIYPYKDDLDFCINVYDSFDSLEKAKEFIKKHEDEFIHSVMTLENNNWTFLGSFKENRERVEFYNKNTDILEKIIKHTEEDQKLGKELLKNRVTNEKRSNIRKYGKHDNKVNTDEGFGKRDTLADDDKANDLSKEDSPFLRVDVFENDGVDLRKSHFHTKPTLDNTYS